MLVGPLLVDGRTVAIGVSRLVLTVALEPQRSIYRQSCHEADSCVGYGDHARWLHDHGSPTGAVALIVVVANTTAIERQSG